MFRYFFKRFFKFTILFLLFFAAMGAIVMWLWNWLLPDLIGASPINYWQALGVLALAKILFGWGGGGARHHRWRNRWNDRWKEKWKNRWQNMSEEDKERIRNACRYWKYPEDKESSDQKTDDKS